MLLEAPCLLQGRVAKGFRWGSKDLGSATAVVDAASLQAASQSPPQVAYGLPAFQECCWSCPGRCRAGSWRALAEASRTLASLPPTPMPADCR